MLNNNLNKAAYSVNELLNLLPLGRTSLYAAIKTGGLKATKFGKRTFFLASDVANFLSTLPSATMTHSEKL
jgi:hypothetical protein